MFIKALKFSVKVWLFSVLTSPILWGISEIYFSPRWNYLLNFGGFYFFSILYGSILSLPILLIFSLLNWVVFDKIFDCKIQKITISIIAVFLNLVLCFIVFGNDDRTTWVHTLYQIAAFYSFTLIVGIWLIKV